MRKVLFILDDGAYKRQERALRRYFMQCYKDLIFNVTNILKKEDIPNGDYEYILKNDKKIEQVYGEFKVKYFVKNNVIGIKEIAPSELLEDLYKKDFPTYKGIPYRNDYDLFKIKLLKGEYK